MPRFRVEVRVMPRPSLLDPEGQAVARALRELGFDRVEGVRVGRALTVELERADAAAAERDTRRMCERLLANPVTEDFTLSIEPSS